MKYLVLIYNDDEMHIADETDSLEEAESVFYNIDKLYAESNNKGYNMELHYYPNEEMFDIVLQRKEYK